MSSPEVRWSVSAVDSAVEMLIRVSAVEMHMLLVSTVVNVNTVVQLGLKIS